MSPTTSDVAWAGPVSFRKREIVRSGVMMQTSSGSGSPVSSATKTSPDRETWMLSGCVSGASTTSAAR